MAFWWLTQLGHWAVSLALTLFGLATLNERKRMKAEAKDAEAPRASVVSEEEEFSMWTMQEEIKVTSRGAAIRKATGFGTFRGALTATAIVGLAIVLAQLVLLFSRVLFKVDLMMSP